MTKHAEQVLAGFAALSDADKREVADEIEHFMRSDPSSRKSIGFDYEKRGHGRILAGSVAAPSCLCCGR